MWEGVGPGQGMGYVLIWALSTQTHTNTIYRQPAGRQHGRMREQIDRPARPAAHQAHTR